MGRRWYAVIVRGTSLCFCAGRPVNAKYEQNYRHPAPRQRYAVKTGNVARKATAPWMIRLHCRLGRAGRTRAYYDPCVRIKWARARACERVYCIRPTNRPPYCCYNILLYDFTVGEYVLWRIIQQFG
uniref:Uncharacterized protein n=1 Tax=Sipha flava TaxID=143950 RepID=A0A2S2R4Q6_9HEMI